MTEESHADAARRHGDGERPRAGEEELFAALDRTRADLAATTVPPLPEGFAARLRDGLAAERARAAEGVPGGDADGGAPPSPSGPGPAGHPSSGSGPARGSARPITPVGASGPARPGGRDRAGRRRRALAAGLLALAAVAAVTGGLLAGGGTTSPQAPTAAPSPGSTVPGGPEPVSGRDPVRALRTGLGARDPGPFADPARRATCLVAHGLPAGTVPLGSRQVSVDGRAGTLLVLPTGTAARFRLLAVGPGCAPGQPETLVDLVVGG